MKETSMSREMHQADVSAPSWCFHTSPLPPGDGRSHEGRQGQKAEGACGSHALGA